MSNFLCFLFFFFLSHLTCTVEARGQRSPIHDPLNIFCGSLNCYEVLEVERESSLKDIKKAYRKLSLTYHPDKNKEENATEVFRIITKAYEVLEKNESRSLFDYYLDHPTNYFKVSGQHYFRSLPKSDVRIVIVVLILLISVFQYYYQESKYQKVFKYLYTCTINNLSEKQGGSKQAMELYTRAVDAYAKHINIGRKEDDQLSVSKNKMVKDPQFERIVKEIVGQVEVEGGYRKPKWSEVLIMQFMYSPWIIYDWVKKYHRRQISTVPFTDEELLEITVEIVGRGMWEEELDDSEKKKLLAMELFKPAMRRRWNSLGKDILLDQSQLDLLSAQREKERQEELGILSASDSEASTKRRKKVAKKPKRERSDEQ